MAEATFERVGKGVLVTLPTHTLYFETCADALAFANQIARAVYFGADQLEAAAQALLAGGEQ